jgi:hypothetical protein
MVGVYDSAERKILFERVDLELPTFPHVLSVGIEFFVHSADRGSRLSKQLANISPKTFQVTESLRPWQSGRAKCVLEEWAARRRTVKLLNFFALQHIQPLWKIIDRRRIAICRARSNGPSGRPTGA